MNIFRTAAMAAIMMVGFAVASAQDQVYRVDSTQAVGAAKIINTRSFFPQVDTSVKLHPVRPPNPLQLSEIIDLTNNLVAGGILPISRIEQGAKFPAINFSGMVPPDPDVAAGPSHLVAVVNTEIAFFTKSGTKTFQQSGNTFFNGIRETSFVFDPKVFYDRINRRFVLMFLELGDTQNNFLVAVSDDSDPNGNWNRYKVNTVVTGANGTSWLDYPGWGYNKDFYVGTGNLFTLTGSGGGSGVRYVLLPIAPMLTGAPVTAEFIADPNTFTVQVSKNWNPTSRYVYGASRGGSGSIRLAAVDTVAKTLTTRSVIVPTGGRPTREAQSTNGNTVDALDARIFTANLRDDNLVVSHCISGSPQLQSRWYDFKLNGWPAVSAPTLNQAGDISSPTLDYHMPAVNMNAAGDISVLFSASSNNVTANIMNAGRKRTDPAGTMSTPFILETSSGNNYTGGRWGDYFGVDIDPVDDLTFWGIGMRVGSSNTWTTSIFSWMITRPGLQSIVLTPNPVLGGRDTTATVTLDEAKPNDSLITLSATPAAAVTIPTTVTIPAGQLTASFVVRTRPVGDQTLCQITADGGGVLGSRTGTLTIRPVGLIAPLDLVPGRVNGGNIVRGTLNLEEPAPFGGASVYLSTSNSLVAEPERNWILVPAGATSFNFNVRTSGLVTDTLIFIRATRSGVTIENDITVRRAPLLGMAFTPSSPIIGGSNVVGEISLDGVAPSGGATITLRSSNTAIVVPTTVTIPAGRRSTTYAITTRAVISSTTVAITATRLGQSLVRNVTVAP